MKKIAFLPVLFASLITGAVAQETDFSASAVYGFESEFIFRGYQISGDTFTPSAEGRVISGDNTFYGGVRTALPTQKEDNKTKMHEYYAGGEFDLGDFIFDIGLSHYEFLPFTDDAATEGVFGVTWDTVLSPTIYAYADLDGEMVTFEGSIGHAIPLNQKSAIMTTAYVGTSEYMHGSSYAGIMVDYSYSFTRYARFTVGARIARLDPDAPDGSDVEPEGDTRSWWGVSFTAGF